MLGVDSVGQGIKVPLSGVFPGGIRRCFLFFDSWYVRSACIRSVDAGKEEKELGEIDGVRYVM